MTKSRRRALLFAAGAAVVALGLLTSCKPSCQDLQNAIRVAETTGNPALILAAKAEMARQYPQGCQVPPTTTTTTLPPGTQPPPPTAGCRIDGQPGEPIEGYRNVLGAEVNAAMHELRPDCEVGGTCLLGNMPLQQWDALVIAKLREKVWTDPKGQPHPYCAGQHEPGVTDEIALSTTTTDPREGFHVGAGDDGAGDVPPGGKRRTVVWSPQAARGAYAAPATQPPPVVPPPPELTDLRPIPDPARGEITGRWFNDRGDFTVRECGVPEHAAAYGFPGRRCYPLGPDLAPQRFGRERFMLGDRSGSVEPPGTPNPFAVCEGQGGPAEPHPENWSQCVPVSRKTAAVRLCRVDGSLCGPWVSR